MTDFYDTDIKCTYHKDYYSDFEKEFRYKEDIMKIFKMDEYDEDKLITNAKKLHKVFNHPIITKQKKRLANEIDFINDDEIGMLILLSYNFLFVTHPCVCEFIQSGGIISETTLKKLIEQLTK